MCLMVIKAQIKVIMVLVVQSQTEFQREIGSYKVIFRIQSREIQFSKKRVKGSLKKAVFKLFRVGISCNSTRLYFLGFQKSQKKNSLFDKLPSQIAIAYNTLVAQRSSETSKIIQNIIEILIIVLQAMQLTFNTQVGKVAQPMLNFFVQGFDISKISFPLLSNTYTLWRNYAYQNISNLQQFKKNPETAIYEFYLISETIVLKQFAQKLLKHIQLAQPKDILGGSYPQQYKIGHQLIQKYNKALEIHSLYTELFQDLTKIPYLSDVFPNTRNYKLSQTYTPKIVSHYQKEEVSEKFSNGLVNKGIGFITEKLFTKTFLLQASTIAIKLNPLAMIASFAFAELIGKVKKEKKGVEISEKINEALRDIEKKAESLKLAYQQCIALLGPGLKFGGESKQKVMSAIKEVMIQDWLQIQTLKDEDGWEVVILNEIEEPQILAKRK